MLVGANALIQVTPGLMIWTIVCFLIALFVLKRYAFGPIQKMIDARRDQIAASIAEADNARTEPKQWQRFRSGRTALGAVRAEDWSTYP